MCDFCGDSPGDHDRPYRAGLTEMRYRFTYSEIRTLASLRRHVSDVRAGYEQGRAYGDLSTDDPDCPTCGQALHLHAHIGRCIGE